MTFSKFNHRYIKGNNMSLNKVFKRTLTALAVSAVVISSQSAFAAQSTVDITGQVKGRAPVIAQVAATGELKVGSKLQLPENYLQGAAITTTVTDEDGDKPLSLWALNTLAAAPGTKLHLEDAEIEWFIYDNLADSTTLGNVNTAIDKAAYEQLVIDGKIKPLPEFTGFTEITVPARAYNKRIGFKVSARTETGNPIFSEPIYILNAYIDGTTGPTDPEVVDPTPPGTVDKPDTFLVVETYNIASDTWDIVYDEQANAANGNIIAAPALGQKLRAYIKDENGNSYDHIYKETAFKWTFFANPGDELDGEPVTELKEIGTVSNGYKYETGEDYFYLNIQNNNGESNIVGGVSQQGYRLKIDIDESQLDFEAENPNPAAPLMAIEPKVE